MTKEEEKKKKKNELGTIMLQPSSWLWLFATHTHTHTHTHTLSFYNISNQINMLVGYVKKYY